MSSSRPLPAAFIDVRSGRNRRLRRAALVQWSRLLLLLGNDYCAFLAAWTIAGALITQKIRPGYLGLHAPFVWLVSALMVAVTALAGLYRGGVYWRSTWALGRAVGFSLLLLLLGWFVLADAMPPFGRSVLALAWVLSVALAGLGRGLLRQLIVTLRRRRLFCTPAFVVADNGRHAQMGRILAGAGYRVVGFATAHQGELPQLLERVIACGAQEAIISTLAYLPGLPGFYRGLRAAGITVRWIPDQGELLLRQVGATRIIGGIPTVEVCPPLLGGMDFRLKRLLDVLLAGAALLVLAPVLVALALLVRLTSPGPAFFIQERVGVGGRLFWMVKFRSMYVDAEGRKSTLMNRNEAQGPLFKLKNDPRVTPLGAFLRRTSLDELPQLWNVLIGDMSIVGPRPPVPAEVAQYERWHNDRLLVLPGITGLWQISGRSDLRDFDDIVRLDLYYIQNWSLGLDLEILLKTVGVVLRGKGAY